jgi:hypothetical protein
MVKRKPTVRSAPTHATPKVGEHYDVATVIRTPTEPYTALRDEAPPKEGMGGEEAKPATKVHPPRGGKGRGGAEAKPSTTAQIPKPAVAVRVPAAGSAGGSKLDAPPTGEGGGSETKPASQEGLNQIANELLNDEDAPQGISVSIYLLTRVLYVYE